jgi:hypothetical protein
MTIRNQIQRLLITPRTRAPLILVLVCVFAFCGAMYGCSGPPRKAAHAFMDHVRKTGTPPYPLEALDSADADAVLRDVARSTGFTVWNFHGRSGPYRRACLFGRLSLPEGGRWVDVALEGTAGGWWRVSDLSFERDCASTRRGDMRLH